MTPEEALKLLASEHYETRLEAARYLSDHARPGDLGLLQAALVREKVSWVRDALETAVQVATSSAVKPSAKAARTDAVHEVTQRLVHEIAPILGTLELYAQKEVPSYDSSRTKIQISRLDQLLIALDRLSAASAPPDLAVTDISTLIKRVAAAADVPGQRVRFQGPDPWTAMADAALLEIALANGLRNAVEASGSDAESEIVISWGASPDTLWIAVLDEGPGPPPGVQRVFDLGASTKEGHAGMGLSLAKQAVETMGGEISLTPRRATPGARLELRWPNIETEEP